MEVNPHAVLPLALDGGEEPISHSQALANAVGTQGRPVPDKDDEVHVSFIRVPAMCQSSRQTSP